MRSGCDDGQPWFTVGAGLALGGAASSGRVGANKDSAGQRAGCRVTAVEHPGDPGAVPDFGPFQFSKHARATVSKVLSSFTWAASLASRLACARSSPAMSRGRAVSRSNRACASETFGYVPSARRFS
jgi:hypothetical protein